jgi:hypothetical protein
VKLVCRVQNARFLSEQKLSLKCGARSYYKSKASTYSYSANLAAMSKINFGG